MRSIRWSLAVAMMVISITAAWAGSAGAVVVTTANGRLVGVTPKHGVSLPAKALMPLAQSSQPAAAADYGVNYQGGIVLHSSRPNLVFWDPSSRIPPRSEDTIARYLTDVAADSGRPSNVYSVLRQYTDATGFADYRQAFSASQSLVDRHAYPTSGNCPTASPYTWCLTDAQVQTELTRLIAARHLPVGTGPGAPVYLMITPEPVNICFDSSISDGCSSNAFCAYHSTYTLGSGQDVLYALVPFAVFEFGPKGCQTDGTQLYQTPSGTGEHGIQIADNLSHELSETLTDPTFTGYYSNATGEEVGDICATYGPTPDPADGLSPLAYEPRLGGNVAAGTLFDQVINGDAYYNQTEWSNGDYNCRAATSGGHIHPVFADMSTTGRTVSLSPAGTTSTAGFSSETWRFGDDSAPTFTRGVPTTVTHNYSHSGTYKVELTVVDQVGNLISTVQTVTVTVP